jgi:hypothetical protein
MVERCFLRNEFSLFILILATNVAFLIIIIREQNDEQLASFVSKKVVFPVFFQDVISTVPGRSFLGSIGGKEWRSRSGKRRQAPCEKMALTFCKKSTPNFRPKAWDFSIQPPIGRLACPTTILKHLFAFIYGFICVNLLKMLFYFSIIL